jgi:ABC-2 type transport system ATP-binding protein
MNQAAIEARGLTKTFPRGVVAVNNLDLSVETGAVYGLMGRNGSGKTTLLRLLLGLVQADHGEARILGCDFWRAPRALRRRVGYVPQVQQLPAGMSLAELSLCQQRFSDGWDRHLARSLARQWALPWNRSVGGFSNGEQRKAAILLAFAGRPGVLILDEPAAGFDLIARRELVALIIDAITQSDGCTVLLSTHIIGDLERVADHLGFMESGRIALSMRLEDLLNTTKRVQVIFDEDGPPDGFAVPGALHARRSGPVVTAIVRWTHGGELESLRASVNGRVQVFSIGLEEIFVELFGSSRADDKREERAATIHSNGAEVNL